MLSLRDAAFAVRDTDGGSWSLRGAATRPLWPPLPVPPVSTMEFCRRFSRAGIELHALADGSENVWTHINKSTIITQVRTRLRDPGVINQWLTALCGPAAVVFELARRRPARYVRMVRELLETGEMSTVTGTTITADQDMRERDPGPQPQIDWLLMATMREQENFMADVEEGGPYESYTMWNAMQNWTRDVLGLGNNGWETCYSWGEIGVMAELRSALDQGGVAFMLIDANLLHQWTGDDDATIMVRKAEHTAAGALGDYHLWTQAKPPGFPPDHWVPVLDGLSVASSTEGEDQITVRVWSWAQEWELTGTADALAGYLYAGVWGHE